MNNNEALIVKVSKVEAIENADKIVKVTFSLNDIEQGQVVSGKDDFSVGDLACYFDSNLCLSEDFIKVYPEMGNYLAKGNRIRCVKLRGVISVGLLIPVVKLWNFDKTCALNMVEGYSFTDLGSTNICKKWLPPVQHSQSNGKKPNKRGQRGLEFNKFIDGQFRFHTDTLQLQKCAYEINPMDVISLSSKIHGSSWVSSNCLVKRKLNFFERIAKKFFKIEDKQYETVAASRTVIKSGNDKPGFYKVDIWSEITKDYFAGKLHTGETVYGEVYGFLKNTASPIQKSGKYNWNYGCKEGEYKIAVYRITSTGMDGNVHEYSWPAIKERCKELNVPMVEELFYGLASDVFPEIAVDGDWNKNFIEALKKKYLNKIAEDCIGKPHQEGIVLKVESSGIKVYKLKDENFLIESRAVKDTDVVVDIEEQEVADNA